MMNKILALKIIINLNVLHSWSSRECRTTAITFKANIHFAMFPLGTKKGVMLIIDVLGML